MKTKSPSHPDLSTGTPDPKANKQAEFVSLAVIRALGRPPELLGVSAVRLWENHFRVNVRTGDVTAAHIPHSFFVTADEDGNVLESVPRLARVY